MFIKGHTKSKAPYFGYLIFHLKTLLTVLSPYIHPTLCVGTQGNIQFRRKKSFLFEKLTVGSGRQYIFWAQLLLAQAFCPWPSNVPPRQAVDLFETNPTVRFEHGGILWSLHHPFNLKPNVHALAWSCQKHRTQKICGFWNQNRIHSHCCACSLPSSRENLIKVVTLQ